MLKINSIYYSLNGDLNPDSVILFQNYANWEAFYLDERGGRSDEKNFNSEEEACLYIYKIFKDLHHVEMNFSIKT